MNKKEFLKQGVEELRADLLTIFEDPDGELAEMTKQPLIAFARENWEVIEENLASRLDTASVEEETESPEEIAAAVLPPEEAEEEEAPLDLEPEPTVDESAATPDESEEDDEPEEIDPWEGNPKTNLHTGAPGDQLQRAGTRDLA